jgi:hemerythrin
MLLEWSEDYSIGIDEIDEQHKKFFAMVHQLYQDCLTCKGERVVPETLQFLKDYAVEHFQAEEAFMEKHEYPGLEGHSRLHAEFLDNYSELTDDFKTFGTSQELADRTAEMVQNWLVRHIAQVDTEYAKHVKNRS